MQNMRMESRRRLDCEKKSRRCMGSEKEGVICEKHQKTI